MNIKFSAIASSYIKKVIHNAISQASKKNQFYWHVLCLTETNFKILSKFKFDNVCAHENLP